MTESLQDQDKNIMDRCFLNLLMQSLRIFDWFEPMNSGSINIIPLPYLCSFKKITHPTRQIVVQDSKCYTKSTLFQLKRFVYTIGLPMRFI